MTRTWTPAQRAAMETHQKTLLVSAAAGSGKTATLTERILRSVIDDHADIGSMLIVTFTRAAAAELRSRIFDRLSDALSTDPANPHLTNQLMKLSSARICTIDSFYLDLLRSNFSVLGISPNFRIAGTAEIDVIARSVMNETIDFFYENDPAFPLFSECFSGIRSENALLDVFLTVDSRCASIPEGIEFLKISAQKTEEEADRDFFDTAFGAVLCQNVADFAEYLSCVFNEAYGYISQNPVYLKPYGEAFGYLRDFSEDLLSATKHPHAYAEIQHLLASYERPAIGRLKKGEETTEELLLYKKLRTSLDKKIRDLYQKRFSKSAETISRAMHDTARHTQKLYEVLREYESRLNKEKTERNLLDFSDIRRYTLKLLVNDDGTPTQTAKDYADTFSEIYIDEYQDVDRVQDTIFRAISRPDNRFMVGDIKQSIYGFRGAEPQVFAEYRTAFPLHTSDEASLSSTETIFMSENFRCDKSIIDFTNTVCSYLFSFCAESIDYRPDDDLVCAKKMPSPDYVSPKVEVAVILPPISEDTQEEMSDEADETVSEKYDKKRAEARHIANRIRALTHQTKADGSPIGYGDIAVLSRTRSMCEYVAEEFAAAGIPTGGEAKDRYFENPDVLMMLSLLNAIDNPHRDIHLAGMLRSPIFSFSLEDLVLIRKNHDAAMSLYDALVETAKEDTPLGARCRSVEETLEEWRDSAASLPIDRLLRMIFDSPRFIASGLVTDGNDSENGGNLLLLYEYARKFEASSFKGLYSFIEFINTVMEEGMTLDSPSADISSDRVTLMTVHQSKGLEFPVCFLCGTGIGFNQQDSRESLLFDHTLGVAMKIADGSGFARIGTPMREAILTNCEKKSIEEEMRVLYVALTRARERLYISGTATDEQKFSEQLAAYTKFPCRYAVSSCKNYLAWICLALKQSKRSDSFYSLSFVEAGDPLSDELPEIEAPEKETDPALLAYLEDKFSFVYPYKALSRLPAKLTVSRLSPDALDEDDSSVELSDSPQKAVVPDFFKAGARTDKNAAERGTSTHLFLQFCNFDYARKHGVREEFARLEAERFLPSDAQDLIYFEELRHFFEHELLETIISARRVIREQRFNLLLPPDSFTKDPVFAEAIREEGLAVQGVIDLLVIDRDGRLCLFDYKTDRLSQAELADPALAEKRMNERHGLQLSYYAHAASLLFGRPCDRVAVYATHSAMLYDIVPQELNLPLISE